MVVEAMADFSRLPYCNGTQDVNSDVANISEEIVSTPFENQNLLLKAGIHLHWSLPDALTRSRPRSRHEEGAQDFPPVPNRWLVTRSAQQVVEQKREWIVVQEWIVESDYLYPVGDGAQSGSVNIPYRDGQAQPFRYMGRKMLLQDWHPKDAKAEYYPKLTALGYGEPTFAAFYPNCHSVFGFYDPDSKVVEGRRYDVIGWYNDPQQDYLKTFIQARAQKPTTNKSLTQALENDFKWTLAIAANEEFPERMVCYASLVFGQTTDQKVDEQITIAIGNTGTEALSAYLAETLNPEKKRDDLKIIIEDQLEALQLSSSLEHRQLDIGPKFREARHEKGFIALPGGSLWNVRPEAKPTAPASAKDAEAGMTLSAAMAHLLNRVNKGQQDYDQAQQEIESRRKQLFSDWYKYMLCAYPPDDARDDYPDIDEVKSYIEFNLLSLKEANARTGELIVKDEGGRISARADGATPLAQAAKLVADINELQATIDRHNEALQAQGAKTTYKLKQVSGPRYWQPREPVVLMTGPAVKPTNRHGQDGRLRNDGLLETQLLEDTVLDNPGATTFEQIRKQIIKIGEQNKNKTENFAFNTRTAQPWHPFLLEWEVEVFPVENKSNLDQASGRYHHDFIKENYTLKENEVELSPQTNKGSTIQAANIYSGRSILTPHASLQLKKQLEAYLKKTILAQYYQAQSIPKDQQRDNDLGPQIDGLEAWYKASNATALDNPESKAKDPIYTAIRALQKLQSLNCLSQSLSGFNEALLMHKQTMQLVISDPLGFDDYQSFAKNVSEAVQDAIYSAPEPLNDFNPIRSGAMRILHLRLVDTFGQFKDLNLGTVITSEPMTKQRSAYTVWLPPRLVQPARINFRWLSADLGEQEMNDHPATTPVCGWVLTNNLDNSLMIYDNQGRSLGYLDQMANWKSAPGSNIKIDGIGNPHLKKMVTYIRDRGAAFLKDFISAVDNALENIEPENFAQHQSLALLMGRPLALVRTSVNLELQGRPAVHQGWNVFRQDMQREQRDDNGFTEIQFPIRLGEYKQFNDGLVGYWNEKDAGSKNDWFYAPQSDDKGEIKHRHIKTHRTDPMTIFQSVNSAPQTLSMLVDPRGLVHATSGLLPAKAISLPPEQYAAALQAIEITFLSTPILTEAGKMRLPLPAEAGYQWSWLQNEAGTWSEISTRGVVKKQAFIAKFKSDGKNTWDRGENIWDELQRQGWIKAIDADRASVAAKDQRRPLVNELQDKIPVIEDILDRAHIGPVNLEAKFSGPQEIREGWLKLSLDKESATASQAASQIEAAQPKPQS